MLWSQQERENWLKIMGLCCNWCGGWCREQRNCLWRMRRTWGTAESGQTKIRLGWFRFRSSCCGACDRLATLSKALPALSPAIAVPVRCRKAPLSAGHIEISLPSHLCKTTSSMQAASRMHGTAAGCRRNGDNPSPSPISGALLHTPGTGAWVSPQGSSVRSAGSSWQQCFLLPDPPLCSLCLALTVLVFADLDALKLIFLLVLDSRQGC